MFRVIRRRRCRPCGKCGRDFNATAVTSFADCDAITVYLSAWVSAIRRSRLVRTMTDEDRN